ncbi:hypothetical protein PCE1_002466 [Barthelona sp. PCE]
MDNAESMKTAKEELLIEILYQETVTKGYRWAKSLDIDQLFSLIDFVLNGTMNVSEFDTFLHHWFQKQPVEENPEVLSYAKFAELLTSSSSHDVALYQLLQIVQNSKIRTQASTREVADIEEMVSAINAIFDVLDIDVIGAVSVTEVFYLTLSLLDQEGEYEPRILMGQTVDLIKSLTDNECNGILTRTQFVKYFLNGFDLNALVSTRQRLVNILEKTQAKRLPQMWKSAIETVGIDEEIAMFLLYHGKKYLFNCWGAQDAEIATVLSHIVKETFNMDVSSNITQIISTFSYLLSEFLSVLALCTKRVISFDVSTFTPNINRSRKVFEPAKVMAEQEVMIDEMDESDPETETMLTAEEHKKIEKRKKGVLNHVAFSTDEISVFHKMISQAKWKTVVAATVDERNIEVPAFRPSQLSQSFSDADSISIESLSTTSSLHGFISADGLSSISGQYSEQPSLPSHMTPVNGITQSLASIVGTMAERLVKIDPAFAEKVETDVSLKATLKACKNPLASEFRHLSTAPSESSRLSHSIGNSTGLASDITVCELSEFVRQFTSTPQVNREPKSVLRQRAALSDVYTESAPSMSEISMHPMSSAPISPSSTVSDRRRKKRKFGTLSADLGSTKVSKTPSTIASVVIDDPMEKDLFNIPGRRGSRLDSSAKRRKPSFNLNTRSVDREDFHTSRISGLTETKENYNSSKPRVPRSTRQTESRMRQSDKASSVRSSSSRASHSSKRKGTLKISLVE